MGKKIDRFVLTSILAAALFFYFQAAFKSNILAIALALFSCMIILRILKSLIKWMSGTKWHRKKHLKRKSSGEIMHLACMEAAKAHICVCALLEKGFQNDAPVILEQLHPTTALSQERIFEIWKMHREQEKLVICTTGKCNSEAKLFSTALSQPKLAIVDAAILSRLISEHPEGFFNAVEECKKSKLRWNHISVMIFNRRNIPRGLLFSFSMAIMYIFSANLWYLAFSMLLLFTVLISLRQTPQPTKLF